LIQKYCIIIRNDTEWTELVDSGYAILAGYDQEIILETTDKLLSTRLSFLEKFYGEGNATIKILETITLEYDWY
jgi:UDP-GlcNAc3NAcA epimerase